MPITQRRQMALKAETVEGTPEVLTAAEAVLCEALNFSPDVDVHERDQNRSTLSRPAAIIGSRRGSITGRVAVKGSGSLGVAPDYGSILQCCGLEETITTGVSVGYTPISGDPNLLGTSYTTAIYFDGKWFQVTGGRGTGKFLYEVGNYGVFDFEIQGALVELDDEALLSGASYDSTVPLPFLNAATAFSYDAFQQCIASVEIDIGNELAARPCPNADSGVQSVYIVRRRPTATFNPEEVADASYDYWAKFMAGNEGVLTWALGTVAGNICTHSMSKTQIAGYAHGDREGVVVADLSALLNMNTGDDEYSLLLT